MSLSISRSATIAAIDARELTEFQGYKRVVKIVDVKTGLKGYIAIHNTNLGPAIGGTRYWHYATEREALRDALRLSRAMTYKCAIANVRFGGGKGVLIAPESRHQKNDAMLVAYADALRNLGEKFFTGEDVGLTEHDIAILEEHSDRIVGRPEVGGLPAHWAALSVFYAMAAALEKKFGDDSFADKSIAIKGLGGVGVELCALLSGAGASLIGADVNPTRVELARSRFPNIRIVPPADIHKIPADVYAPCALGGEFNERSVAELASPIVCGAANNQLETEEDGRRLFRRGTLYLPDYLANAGGLVSVADELDESGYSRERVIGKIRAIRDVAREILDVSQAEKRPTNEVADAIAEKRFLGKNA